MHQPNNNEALDKFVKLAATIHTQLQRLQTAADNHFDLSPEEIGWGHVGDLTHYAEKLRELTDCVFKEGEYAA